MQDYEDLQHQLTLAKKGQSATDTELQDLTYKLQRKDRELQSMTEQYEDEARKRKRDVVNNDTLEMKNVDLSQKLESTRVLLDEQERQIHTLKTQSNKQAKKFRKEKSLLEESINSKQNLMNECQIKYDLKLEEMQRKLESLQKMNVDKEIVLKQKEFNIYKEKEDFEVTVADYQRKIAAKDALVERLEAKLLKAEKTEDRTEHLKERENRIMDLETTIARLESDQASKSREHASALRSKEAAISKLEMRNKKLESANKENQKKLERFTDGGEGFTTKQETELKEMRQKLRKYDESSNYHETKLREMAKLQSEQKEAAEARLKKREREFLQQKRLLERVLAVVKAKALSNSLFC
jgi:hypothetical protein